MSTFLIISGALQVQDPSSLNCRVESVDSSHSNLEHNVLKTTHEYVLQAAKSLEEGLAHPYLPAAWRLITFLRAAGSCHIQSATCVPRDLKESQLLQISCDVDSTELDQSYDRIHFLADLDTLEHATQHIKGEAAEDVCQVLKAFLKDDGAAALKLRIIQDEKYTTEIWSKDNSF
jgi:hypothetical protein